LRRLFFALWPDPGWCEALLDAAQPLLAGAAGSPLAQSDLHVTLCFLGAVDEPMVEPLRERAASIDSAAFELLFDAFEYWPRARILAATCSSAPAASNELASTLRASALGLGLQPDLKPWRAHMTLLRAASGQAQRLLAEPAPALRLTLPAPGFYLAQSHELAADSAETAQRRRYTVLARWPLRAAQP
jgi:RNA 2',3'-cyclic 3'-phosphodiesterase